MSAALRQLLEFGLFHGDPHPGNVFAMRDGRIAYVDFGNVAVLSQVIDALMMWKVMLHQVTYHTTYKSMIDALMILSEIMYLGWI